MIANYLLLLTTAAAMTPSTPATDPANWVTLNDLGPFKSGGTTEFDLMVSIDGRPVKCVVTSSSGNLGLDEAICRALMQRARFKSAADAEQMAVPSIWGDRVRWRPKGTGNNRFYPTPSEVIVSFPEGVKPASKPVKVEIIELLDDRGVVEKCAILKPAKMQQLNDTACYQSALKGARRLVLNGKGEPVKGIRTTAIVYSKSEPRPVPGQSDR